LGLIEKAEADDVEERGQAVLPADLLALGIVTAGVGDGHLVDAAFLLGHFGRDLGLAAESFRLDFDSLRDFAAEDLVTRLHIGEVQVAEHVGKGGQKTVGHVMPEEEHAVRPAEKAAAVDDVGPAVQHGLEELKFT